MYTTWIQPYMSAFYLFHRSLLSRALGRILGIMNTAAKLLKATMGIHTDLTLLSHDGREFECSCCAFVLGAQDWDVLYNTHCRCHLRQKEEESNRNNDNRNNNNRNNQSSKPAQHHVAEATIPTHMDDTVPVKYCQWCVSTYATMQVMEQQVAVVHCMTVQCVLGDALVRQRMRSPEALARLDRNQIDQAACFPREKLWHCPTPDCTCVAYISSTILATPITWLHRALSIVSSNEKYQDQRKVQCPMCRITSCQFCHQVWTKGIASHEHVTCPVYARQLCSDEDALLQQWCHGKPVQMCPAMDCHRRIEKHEGCSHMTCRCGHEFCWHCRKPWCPGHVCESKRQ
jgi:hypothetical protein